MNLMIKIATEQAFAFLLGLGAVSVIQPLTAGGTILLICIVVAIVNMILLPIKFMLGRHHANEEEPRIGGEPDGDSERDE
ncbi:hypothetical protein L6654_24165 [Bradyrhizobium sp. WYCCWR 13023]|uniref:Uncharacterized protein n=1 Tax=Bradyrhizobium zhengyangense TaxID=2911009 RepID=A0A9X1REQ3_9BRAD|nr:hypothetical protein [Bradyrhizobium zhengyangense]MCG2629723.1 hypothetical protein [Bradyrhizobium zhengyangense]